MIPNFSFQSKLEWPGLLERLKTALPELRWELRESESEVDGTYIKGSFDGEKIRIIKSGFEEGFELEFWFSEETQKHIPELKEKILACQ